MVSTNQLKQNNERVYIYTDEEGNQLYSKVRVNGEKTFTQYTAVSSEYWEVGVNCRQTLYNLEGVMEAKRTGRYIFFCEGEKDVETLRRLGLYATTSGSTSSWKPEYAEFFRNMVAVYILPDNDSPGKKFASTVAESIVKTGTPVKIIDLSNLKEKQDITDWIEQGGTVEELKELIRSTKWYEKKVEFNGNIIDPITDISVKDLMKKVFPPVKWHIEDILPEGLSVFVGPPKIGKSWFALNAFLSIANGDKCLGHLKTQQSAVAYLALEDSERRLQDRINDILSANPHQRIPEQAKFAKGIKKLEEGGIEQIYDYINKNPHLKLIIIDTLQRVRKTSGGNSYQVDTELLAQLHKIYLDRGVSIMVIHHTRKNQISDDWLNDISGSQGIAGVCDTIIGLKKNRFESEGVLMVTGRDIREEKELTVRFNSLTYNWELLGNGELRKMSSIQRDIIDIIKDSEKPLTNKEIADLTGKTYNNIRKITKNMEDKGYISNASSNKKIKYILSSTFNFESSNSNNDDGSSNSSSSGNSDSATYETVIATESENNSSSSFSNDNVVFDSTATIDTVDSPDSSCNMDRALLADTALVTVSDGDTQVIYLTEEELIELPEENLLKLLNRISEDIQKTEGQEIDLKYRQRREYIFFISSLIVKRELQKQEKELKAAIEIAVEPHKNELVKKLKEIEEKLSKIE